MIRSSHDRSSLRAGGAMVFTLFLMAAVAGLSVGILRMSSSVTRQTRLIVDNKRAFYIAEAGLSEAYYNLGQGKTGRLASPANPARFGDGLIWVDATRLEGGEVQLEAYALCASGRASLAIVVEEYEEPIGIFSDEDIEIEAPLLLDGYDSTEGTYYEQSGQNVLVLQPDEYGVTWKEDTVDQILYHDGLYYHYTSKSGYTYYYDFSTADSAQLTAYLDQNAVPIDSDAAALAGDPVFGTGGTGWGGTTVVQEPSPLGPTTSGGGLMGSNGDISLGTFSNVQVEVYGEVMAGPDGEILAGNSTLVTGASGMRSQLVMLPPIEVPGVELLPGLEVGGMIPQVVPPSTVGYESIVVRDQTSLSVVGPANVVTGDFTLDAGSELRIDNGAGPVNLYVTGTADWASGSIVTVESDSTDDLSLQISGTQDSRLEALSQFHGIVYAPDALLVIGPDFEIYGGLVANQLQLSPLARLHFDSGFLGSEALPRLVAWRIVDTPTAIAVNRQSPSRLLDVSLADAPLLHEVAETTSWFFHTKYIALDGSTQTYVGPYDEWDSANVDSYLSAEFVAPTADLPGEWSLYLDYESLFSQKVVYDGLMKDFSGYVKRVNLRVLTPPPGFDSYDPYAVEHSTTENYLPKSL